MYQKIMRTENTDLTLVIVERIHMLLYVYMERTIILIRARYNSWMIMNGEKETQVFSIDPTNKYKSNRILLSSLY